MPVFSYRGLDNEGKHISGVMEANDEAGLEHKLRDIGFWLIDARSQDRAGGSWFHSLFWSKVSRRDLIDFSTLLGFQIKAGVPLIQALEVATQECENPAFRFVLEGVYRNIEAGSMLYEALEKYPDAFPSHLVSLVRAGELSGNLPETFNNVRLYLEWLDRIVADVRQASIYPAIVLTVILTFVLLLFTFVIPMFAVLLKEINAPLPPLTQFIFGLSHLVKSTWWLWLFLSVGGFVLVQAGRRLSPFIALQFDRLRLSLPAFGELNRMIAISRFTYNLAVMYRSGIPILQSLNLCQSLVGNVVIETAIRDIERSVAAGDTISESMARHKVFPPLVLRMVLLGETTGNLDQSLNYVSEYYNEIIPRRLKKIFSLMEPLMMIVLIGMVGTVALSIFMPILDMMSRVR